tara:strand:+ start:311 stop:730 length:420 start_codon:yes stop_codon:yes gene_type:complete
VPFGITKEMTFYYVMIVSLMKHIKTRRIKKMNKTDIKYCENYFWSKLDKETKININNLNNDLYIGPLDNFNFSDVADKVKKSIDEIIYNTVYYDSFCGQIIEKLDDDLSELDYENIYELDSRTIAEYILGSELKNTLYL